ncbi:polyprenol phosphomannose-dependent alpha 1,6 mannosyltransferase MptB [Actinomadura parmotrematis]|uniref:Polyprenol phosphomannose-dependent alpha 1,6 mannosyltransferase MptB n=1 Tax=Actinomadura parmotrematis TaxID=2864039 RepID=A0ABS7FN19_9ACTN|nr:polyprenol phosphomannose-dependent alpha 1,6 mannosyltransferase MptB [Actinomadura parmotrematis]MBW8481756.1 polyprenol phosphomannose-dependent alpha 1,6 mannosyltransferase MptB [Actinomadura parmotrematis]
MTPRAGLAAIGASLGCFLLTALLGPSAFQPALPGPAGQPPFSLHAHPSPYLVVGLVAAGVLAGVLGLALCFRAVRRGWEGRARPLVAAGLVAAAAFALMPPVGSADHLNYASYGRMAATGHDPYATTANDVPGDPVIGAAEEWRDTPSVYGPVTTAAQALASRIGGDSVRLTVFVLSVMNAAAFALAALLLHRLARDGRGRLRAALLWTCNPLLLFHLVAGGHNDVLAIAPMVAALGVFHARSSWPRALASGALTGFGAVVKLPAAFVGGGPVWVLLRARRWTQLAALLAGAVVVAGGAYALAGPHALDQVTAASDMISLATPWHLLAVLVRNRTLVKIVAYALLAVLVVLLGRALPDAGDGGERRAAAALVLAWLFTAPYELPWYDGFGWALLALLPWSRFDAVLLAHTGALSLAYLPARAPERIGLPGGLHWLVPVLRSAVIPLILTAVLAALVRECLRARRTAPATAARPRSPAAPPR